MKLRSSSSFGIPVFLSFLFIFTLPSHVLTTTTTTNNNNSFIRTTCKKFAQGNPIFSYDFCVSSLEAAPNSHRAKDVRQLGDISLMLLRLNVTESRSYIEQLLKHKKMETPIRVRLDVCLEVYSLAILDAKEAIQDYNAKRYGDATTQVSAVEDAPMTCEDAFKEIPGLVSPLTVMNNVTDQLCAISFAIIHMLSA